MGCGLLVPSPFLVASRQLSLLQVIRSRINKEPIKSIHYKPYTNEQAEDPNFQNKGHHQTFKQQFKNKTKKIIKFKNVITKILLNSVSGVYIRPYCNNNYYNVMPTRKRKM